MFTIVFFYLIACFKYELTLVASDSLNENYTTVVIHIKDANDLPPKFDRILYKKDINEELPGQYPLLLMQVSSKTQNISLGRVWDNLWQKIKLNFVFAFFAGASGVPFV